MNHETKEQAAREWVDANFDFSMMHTMVGDMTREAYAKYFIAGAAWREQQAASGYFEFCRDITPEDLAESNKAKDYNDPRSMPFRLWQASALHSAKLLAEKDAEIERLKQELKQRANQIGVACLKHDLTHSLACGRCLEDAKGLIKEMRDALNFYSSNVTSVWDCNGEHLLEDESEMARKTLKESAEKIKALLGEE